MWQLKRHFMCNFIDKIFLMSQWLVNCYITGWKRYIQTRLLPKFIKYVTDIRRHFTIKNRIAKNKVVSITIKPIIFFKSIIGLI